MEKIKILLGKKETEDEKRGGIPLREFSHSTLLTSRMEETKSKKTQVRG